MFLLVWPAYALESQFSPFEEAGQEFSEKERKLSGEFGGVFTTGNTEFLNLNTAINGSMKWTRNKLGLVGGATVGRGAVDTDLNGTLSDAERFQPWTDTAKRASVELRYDRFVGKKDSIYGLAGLLVDPFGGYKTRTHEQVGYSRILYGGGDNPTELVGEIGADVAQERFVEGVEPSTANVLAARAMVGVTHAFSDTATFTESLEAFENVLLPSDLRLKNVASVTAKLNELFGLKVSHEFRFDNEPVPGFIPADQQSTVTLVVTVL